MKKKIFDAITNVDDEIIKEARAKKELSFTWKKTLVLAASILVIIGAVFLIISSLDNGLSKSIKKVVYPKAYAFNDYDSLRNVREENPVSDSTLIAINDFAYRTSSQILKESNKNANYSPLSLYYALGLATSGANGETQRELLTLLGMPDSETLSHESGNLYRLIYRENKVGSLKIANSIWLGDEINGTPLLFKDNFLDNAVNNFYASSFNVDFSKAETGKQMGKWIAENTNNKLVPEIETDSEHILALINTIYFYDQWGDEFEKSKTKEGAFYLLNGHEVAVDYMNQIKGSAVFTRGENFTRSSLSLKNGGSMVFILPDEDVSLYDLFSSSENTKEAFEGGMNYYGQVVWQLPKFNFNSKFSLIDTLKKLGINNAFQPDADFSGITDQMAFISEIQQETQISIDEKGVEASAFTTIYLAGAGMPEGRADMILDRPFIYGITAPNGSLLFIGICLDPADAG